MIYYRQLIHALMDAGKFQDLLGESAKWNPRKAASEVLI